MRETIDTNQKSLNRIVPVFGPIGNPYCCKGLASRTLSAEDQRSAKRLKAAEMALYQGDYEKSVEMYAKIPKDSPLFLSAGRVRNLASGIYTKLHITRRAELDSLMW